jgi:hypothetical protein
MKFNKIDLNHSRNMLKVLGKGEWKLDGMEILAFAEMMKWFSHIQKTVELEVAQDEVDAKRVEAQKTSSLEPKPVVPPITSIDGPKTAKKSKV